MKYFMLVLVLFASVSMAEVPEEDKDFPIPSPTDDC